jgi:hypothetical protein
MLQLCALPMALSLLLAPARAQAPEPSQEEAPPELPADAPLDLSTPEPDPGALKLTTPFADKPSTPEWISKAGIDYSKPAIPADKAAIDTRVDPSHEQGKLGTTLSRSVPVGDDVSLTLQNGVSMTRSLPNATGPVHSWATSQALRFNFLPTDTSVSFGADISSTDDKWLRTLSAEQKLFGGPFSVTGSVSETATGDLSKSLKAGFKRNW